MLGIEEITKAHLKLTQSHSKLSKPKHFLTSLKQKSYNKQNDAVVPNIIEGNNNRSENEKKCIKKKWK